ncbi:MAG: hypothetical protein CL778_02800 [Chloroflexi bacterium]|nr:hypothetical protein [Chloroflexota bacterium]
MGSGERPLVPACWGLLLYKISGKNGYTLGMSDEDELEKFVEMLSTPAHKEWLETASDEEFDEWLDGLSPEQLDLAGQVASDGIAAAEKTSFVGDLLRVAVALAAIIGIAVGVGLGVWDILVEAWETRRF